MKKVCCVWSPPLWKITAAMTEKIAAERGESRHEAGDQREAAGDLDEDHERQQRPGTPMCAMYCSVPA